MSPEPIGSCSASERSCGCEEYEHNNECWAIEVIGQEWSSEVVALFLVDLFCQEMRDTCWDSPESPGSP